MPHRGYISIFRTKRFLVMIIEMIDLTWIRSQYLKINTIDQSNVFSRHQLSSTPAILENLGQICRLDGAHRSSPGSPFDSSICNVNNCHYIHRPSLAVLHNLANDGKGRDKKNIWQCVIIISRSRIKSEER